jgi:hypothetical protein
MLKGADAALNIEGIQISSPSESKLNLRLVCLVGNFRSLLLGVNGSLS